MNSTRAEARNRNSLLLRYMSMGGQSAWRSERWCITDLMRSVSVLNGAVLFTGNSISVRINRSVRPPLTAGHGISINTEIPHVYTKPNNDFRLFTKTPRNSKAWRKAYARRTTVERTIKRILVDYDIESLRFRAEKRWFWSASLAAINMHLGNFGVY